MTCSARARALAAANSLGSRSSPYSEQESSSAAARAIWETS